MDEGQRRQASVDSLLRRELDTDYANGLRLCLSDTGSLVEAAIAPVCSQGVSSRTCQWAWVNREMAEIAVPDAARSRELAEITGMAAFSCETPFAATGDEMRELLSRIVFDRDALGHFGETVGTSVWIFVVIGIERDLGKMKMLSGRVKEILARLLALNAVAAFNQVREMFPNPVPDFSGQNLRGDPEAWKGDLHAQELMDLGIIPSHQARVLDGINFSGCRLDGVNLRGVSLKGASFGSSSLVDADLTGALLEGSDFCGAFLNGANFTASVLGDAGFSGAELGRTLLIDTDLSDVRGLDDTHHSTASEISFSTLVKSGFGIGEAFLRATGVSVGLLDDLRRGKRLGGEYGTCFLSYSTKDTLFARRLYDALLEVGVRVFFDCKNVDAGEPLEVQLVKAIRGNDRMITVFSEVSVLSPWLQREVRASMYYKPEGFTPIRICEIEVIRGFIKDQEIKPDFVDGEARLVVDFSSWSEEGGFESGFRQLLGALRK